MLTELAISPTNRACAMAISCFLTFYKKVNASIILSTIITHDLNHVTCKLTTDNPHLHGCLLTKRNCTGATIVCSC